MQKVSLQEIKLTHEMLIGFREGVREGTFQGRHLRHIAMGLEFLDNMVIQSKQTLEMAKKQQEFSFLKAKEAIQQQGGEINGDTANPASNPN